MKTILQERRKDTEMKFMEICRLYGIGNINAVDTVKIKTLKIFFDILDVMDDSHHAEMIDRLYFSNNHSLERLEDIANEMYVDISTLRRYRQKYIKVILYITDPPFGSGLHKEIEKVRFQYDRANSARPN